jgi:hypothetical protein
MTSLFDRFKDPDGTLNLFIAPSPITGLLREHGLTSMLLHSGIDKELSARIVKRAQWLTEQYVRSCHAPSPTRRDPSR